MDRRTRAAKRWAALRTGYVAELGRDLEPGDDHLLDALADAALEREALRGKRLAADRAAGERQARTTLELLMEWRRLRRLLGLDQPDPADEPPSLERLMADAD